MSYCNRLIRSFTRRLLGNIVAPWRYTGLLVGRFDSKFLFVCTMISRLLDRHLYLGFLTIIFALISLRGLYVRSRGRTLLIGSSLGTLFLSLHRCIRISSVLIRTVIVLFCLFLMVSRWFSIWSIVVLVTVGRRFLLCVHYVNSMLI